MTATGDKGSTADAVDVLIARWTASGARVIADSQTLAGEFCDLVGALGEMQVRLAVEPLAPATVAQKLKWPSGMLDQMQHVKAVLDGAPQALAAEQITTAFKGAWRKTINDLLATLAAIGQTRQTDNERYASR